MSLVEGKGMDEGNGMITIIEANFVGVGAAIQHWEQFPASVISHHGTACCQIAREWILAMDYSQLNAGDALTGPRWLRHQYTWGPSKWPIHWCEAVTQKTLDCGALADLAHQVFLARGVQSYRAQLIQQFSEQACSQWRHKWEEEECSPHWIKEDLIYHEGCAIRIGTDKIKLWDASAGWWVNPQQSAGYGSLRALRIFAPETDARASFVWGAHLIRPNRWQRIENAKADASAPPPHQPNVAGSSLSATTNDFAALNWKSAAAGYLDEPTSKGNDG